MVRKAFKNVSPKHIAQDREYMPQWLKERMHEQASKPAEQDDDLLRDAFRLTVLRGMLTGTEGAAFSNTDNVMTLLYLLSRRYQQEQYEEKLSQRHHRMMDILDGEEEHGIIEALLHSKCIKKSYGLGR